MRNTTGTKANGDRPDERLSVSEPGPRRRLLDVANELFYQEGVHVVGIDRLLEEAGVAKASLYTHFGNKDGLVRAYLEERFAARREHVARVLAIYDSPRDRLLGMFADVQEALTGTAFRGCRFINASAEARPDESVVAVTEEYRTWLRTLFTDLAKAAGARDAKHLGRQLALLYDGVAVAAHLDKDRTGAGAAARSAAAALLDAAAGDAPVVRQRRKANAG
ncbi:MAG: TetR family transcriptional regulator [Pseudonocardiales bacterium]|jgi:AcrR family transcriptional regulator|nr:TetR family transcriptional regulator [Pseudonocardiales bacterium]